MADWPSSLPDFNVDGFGQEDQDPVVRFSTEAGPEHTRRRYTAVTTRVSTTLALTRSEVATLLSFFRSTISYGAVPFTWEDPLTESSVEMKIRNPPNISGGPDNFSVRLNLEIMP